MPRQDPPLPGKLASFRELTEGTDTNSKRQQTSVANSDASAQNSKSAADFSLYLQDPLYTLDDVILPESTKRQVNSVMTEIKYKDLIYEEWGMGEKHKLDKALSINFSGPPGTGKTLAAQAIAHKLNLKILIVPYDQLESKYVGETPKNIVSVFQLASEQNALLFFDEADSFLGKRLENVMQSSDTAVNLTRSVMITQLSAYEGVVIFATNLARNYDAAFVSRIRWKLQFALPDEQARKAIWKVQIPHKLPLNDDVDFAHLAAEFDGVSGRDIKNAVFKAVVAAASEDKADAQKKVTQDHFRQAMKEVIEGNDDISPPLPELKISPIEANVKPPNSEVEFPSKE